MRKKLLRNKRLFISILPYFIIDLLLVYWLDKTLFWLLYPVTLCLLFWFFTSRINMLERARLKDNKMKYIVAQHRCRLACFFYALAFFFSLGFLFDSAIYYLKLLIH